MVRTTVWQKLGLIVLGVFLTLVIIELGLRFGGFVFLSLQQYGNSVTDTMVGDEDYVYHILTLGESTTASLHNYDISWHEQLEIILNNKSREVKFKVFNGGVIATNTVFILSRLESNLDKYDPDMVITLMGTGIDFLVIGRFLINRADNPQDMWDSADKSESSD